ncbi:MAG: helix-turn-helix transcriptional regulator [Armatimonadetes bacterium]|nr:helix-turn-helix transcriptional regulator [Armatimonadota bacterium]
MKFPVKIYKEGKWWMAEVPDIEAVTQGHTHKEARSMALDLLLIHLQERWHRQDIEPSPIADGEWIEVPLRTETALRIRRERKRAGLSIKEAAEKIGVSHGTYARWEHSQACNATLSTLERVAEAFGKSVELSFR